MKRTAAAFVLVAGLGGCVSPDSGKKTALADKARESAASASPSKTIQQAEARSTPRNGSRGVMNVEPGTITDPAVRQAAGRARLVGPGCTDCGPTDGAVSVGGYGPGGFGPGGYPEEAYGPRQGFIRTRMGGGGIMPAPGMGPPGVVAGQGFMGPGLGMNAMFPNQRTSIRFAAPGGMKIAFQDPARGFADAGREAPVRYNFPQGSIYRLRLSGIPNRPGKNYYPTLEIYPSTLKTITFLSHATVPIGFTDEDFEQVNSGNLVVKVIYLPDPAFQDLAAAEEIVSTRLEPGVDPVTEANRRGTILAVIRIGNIDLEDPSTPAMDAPPAGMMMPPGMIPPGAMMPPPGMMLPPGGPPSGSALPSPRTLPKDAEPMTPSAPMTPSTLPMPPSGSGSRVPSTLPPLRVPSTPGN